jgi:hypothetical protein
LTNNPPRFYGNHLHWPVSRSTWPFRAFVVEPELYACTGAGHGDIFNAALSSLIVQQPVLVDDYKKYNSPPPLEPFDLVTFPEAFLPTDRLLSTLDFVARSGLQGCIHVGLRPSANENRHLFSVDELWAFIDKLKTLENLNKSDLDHFSDWLRDQRRGLKFNVGCLFTVDSEGEVRICLHPKLVRSKIEFSALIEGHMEEANLLTVVTLHPINKKLLTINIQPILCSDALRLPTDRPDNKPLEAIHAYAECLSKAPPDHIDVVSVATCTVQKEVSSPKSAPYRTWHEEFRDTFRRTASDDGLARHHFAVFILSNFRMISKVLPGGLSGAFVPMDPGNFPSESRSLDFVSVSQWGKPRSDAQDVAQGANNRWSIPEDDVMPWSGLSYIASLSSFSGGASSAIARMFGFELPRLPRHMPGSQSKLGLAKCVQKIADPSVGASPLIFVDR